MNVSLSSVPCPVAPYEPDSVRGRLDSTDAQIEDLGNAIDRLCERLSPVLEDPGKSAESASVNSISSPRCSLTGRCERQRDKVYALIVQISEIESRLSI